MIVGILGLGKTGISIAKHFKQQGAEVWGIDDRGPEEIQNSLVGINLDKTFFSKEFPDLASIDRFFISPGVSPEHPVAVSAKDAGLKLEGELDLAFSLCQGKVIAITGTNGKSTTTSLIGEMLKQEGLAAGAGGNLGIPFLDLVNAAEKFTHFVIEVSSFQLESTTCFKPSIAVLLNLSDDHLERHHSLNEYLQAKQKIFTYQDSNDLAVYNDDDLRVLETIEKIKSKKIPFSNTKKVLGAYGNEDELFWAPQGKTLSRFSLENCKLQGIHNLENMSAALACVKLLNISDQAIQNSLDQFDGLPHRVQQIATIDGVRYYDDSKATNVGAVVMSLASFDQDVCLILGGVDKGGDYSPLRPLIKAKANIVYVLGEAQEKILSTLEGCGQLVPVANIEEAILKSQEHTKPGATVLLSPACSSFDQYKNYHERGLDFQHWVKKLQKE